MRLDHITRGDLLRWRDRCGAEMAGVVERRVDACFICKLRDQTLVMIPAADIVRVVPRVHRTTDRIGVWGDGHHAGKGGR